MKGKDSFYNRYVKRGLDIVCSSAALIVFSPLFLVLAAVGAVEMKGNPFFAQERPGKDEKIFRLIKFRTMTDERDENGELLPDEVRLNRYGRFLRSTSLDELPEAVNILKGDMSVVGPRPLLVKYLDRYNEEQHHRHDVRPGLTGYAQVHGRNTVSWEDKFRMDVMYARNITFTGDVKIVLQTVRSVLKHEGISSGTSATMEEFMGGRKVKTIMILGDNPESAVLVRTANEQGFRTVVVGVNRNTEPKLIAAKAYDVNALDVNALEKIAHEEKIDGVSIGVADILVPSYTELCDRLGFPCYSSYEAVKYLSHKSLFKEQLKKVGLPVIPEYQDYEDYHDIPLPVFVKPVDSGGGVGITAVYSYDKLQEAIDYAYDCSHSRTIQIEKLMTGDIVACYYTLIDGKVYLSSIEDNLFTKKQPDKCPVTTGHLYASRYLDVYLEKYHEKMSRLLNNVSADNGILQINAFVEDGEFYFYDPGYRLQGEAQHHILNAVNGFDHKKMLLDFAATGSMFEGDFNAVNDPKLHDKACASLWVLLKAGEIGEIVWPNGFSDDRRVIFNGQRFFEGDIVEERFLGTEKQVFSRIYLVADSRDDLKEIVSIINNQLKIRDISGENMILDMLDAADV